MIKPEGSKNRIILMLLCALFASHPLLAQKKNRNTVEVGVATINITPEGPILLAGYGERKSESLGVLQPLYAKALAFGSDAEKPSVLITVDLIGIQLYMTQEVGRRLKEKIGLDPAQFAICATHTPTGPEIGNLIAG